MFTTRLSLLVCLFGCWRICGAQAPERITAATRADPARLAALETPGKILFEDGFESDASWGNYFDHRGRKEGSAQRIDNPSLAHYGQGCMQFTAANRDGKSAGAGLDGWLGAEGYDRLYFRRYIKFDAEYFQGNLNHTGGGLSAVKGDNKWGYMGRAGKRPQGNDYFHSRFEPWIDWQKVPPPGYLFLYTYWMDMERDKDGNFWGNMLGPSPEERIVPPRGEWVCMEQMIKANTPGKFDGELAAWVDGKLYIHYTGLRWRTSAEVKLKRFEVGIYIHESRKENTVWYDDLVISTGYIGPAKE